ncbi:hypothetical protein B0H10DRAFT_1297762 [Mycena sp. CBHHK59/15]|nr:hypothetical protein B0H10DRAFT_1297762 [Mycena sp. CBHHK59/15]
MTRKNPIVLFDRPSQSASWPWPFTVDTIAPSILLSTIMSTMSASFTNPGHSSAKSQKTPMTVISAPHPLLKSSRGRVLWPEQRPTILDKKRGTTFDDDDAEANPGTRQRTSSVTSIETIRLKTKMAVALLKPKPPLDDSTSKRSTRKRTHSATSPSVDDDDSGALQSGPASVKEPILPPARLALLSTNYRRSWAKVKCKQGPHRL